MLTICRIIHYKMSTQACDVLPPCPVCQHTISPVRYLATVIISSDAGVIQVYLITWESLLWVLHYGQLGTDTNVSDWAPS